MAYPGLILGNAAIGEGVEVHLFFTFWGMDMIIPARMNGAEVQPQRQHRDAHAVGDVRIPQALAPMPGMQPMATKMLKKQIADLGVPEVPEFLEHIVASGGHLHACRMSADMNHVTLDDLYEGVEDIINASDFIELTAGAQLLFI